MTQSTFTRRDTETLGVIVLAIACGALVRWLAAGTDLWLDEIWSVNMASRIHSPLEILTAIHHDNNHHLNTLYLYVIGRPDSFVAYRLHSLVASVLAIGLGAAIAWPWGRVASAITSVLLAGSYLLIHYGSESRGYSLAILFAFACVLVTRRFSTRPSRSLTLAFWILVPLGFLSHLSFLHVFLGLVAWIGASWMGESRLRERPILTASYLGVPALFVFALFMIDVRWLFVGGGPSYSVFAVVASTLSYLVGGPALSDGSVGGLVALVAGLASVAALGLAWRSDRAEFAFFAVATLLAPVLLVTVRRPEVLFERYFLLPAAFLLLLLGALLGRVFERSRIGAASVVVAIILFLIGSGLHVERLLSLGRDGYPEMLRLMSELEPSSSIRLGGSHARLDKMVDWFYAPLLPEAKPVEHLPENEWPSQMPDWYLYSLFASAAAPTETIELLGTRYVLVSVHVAPALVDPDRALYRRAPLDESARRDGSSPPGSPSTTR